MHKEGRVRLYYGKRSSSEAHAICKRGGDRDRLRSPVERASAAPVGPEYRIETLRERAIADRIDLRDGRKTPVAVGRVPREDWPRTVARAGVQPTKEVREDRSIRRGCRPEPGTPRVLVVRVQRVVEVRHEVGRAHRLHPLETRVVVRDRVPVVDEAGCTLEC